MISCKKPLVLALLPAASFAVPLTAAAQRAYTPQDYASAERWMGYNLGPLVDHTLSEIQYLPDGGVFFRDPTATQVSYRIADATGKIQPAFDTARLAAALGKALGTEVGATHLRLDSYTPEERGAFAVTLRGDTFHCSADAATCTKLLPAKPAQQPEQKPNAQPAAGLSTSQVGGNAQMASQPANKPAPPPPAPSRRVGRTKAPFDLSPDKKRAAFIRDNNLWVRVEATGEERQLTTDGVADYGYATDNAGWTHSDAPILIWSPDSRKIATFQQDQRKDGMMYLVSVSNRHPTLEAWRYPFLGDKDVTKIERVVIDVDTAKLTRLKMPPDEHRSTLCDDVSCRGGSGWDDVQFTPDSKSIAFVSTSRDHKDEWLRLADTSTGQVRTIFHDHVPTYYESGQGKVNWRYLPATNEFLWYSERSDWGQMYLYDASTGKLKNEITHGEGPVTEVLHVDDKNRVLYFLATGKEKGQDPYFTHFYRVNFDGSDHKLLTPENADHAITPSPDGRTFVDIYSTREAPETAVLRDNTGKLLVTLAHQDISKLLAAGWKAPTPITVNARDGKTPLYGYLWKPTTLDASKKYPVVDYVYPGPQVGSCGSRSFSAADHDNQALAELGFIVVCIDGMGTPLRSKSFHDVHASSPEVMGEATIPDQVAGIKQLGARLPWIDLDRVGIWGHSGGGNATASAMFHFPEFFKVGWSESGNHDNRDYEDDWDEKYAGLEVVGPHGEDNYEAQANQNYVANLKGHLMLVHGTMDDNVPPTNTLTVVDALMKANKSFDMLMVPNAHHGYGEQTQYIMRRRWDYFVHYLAGGTPPENYQLKSYSDVYRALYGPDAQ
ncbi:MAG TPA: DPP IV N-terminal domain-containing protein [Acidobacteriaceae bacterium]|jgi:dipeptidyl aminopeptidase/acylaminoacyl peptidase|nr:DPP IV N-terminal domain-containing protein [Acidobacteriaceae bacterium]